MIIKKLIFLFCLLVSMSIYSQNSLEEMKEPYVKVVDNDYIIEDYTLYSDVTNKNSLQIKIKAEVEKNLMHRDHFIRIVTNTEELITSLLLQEMKIDIKKYNSFEEWKGAQKDDSASSLKGILRNSELFNKEFYDCIYKAIIDNWSKSKDSDSASLCRLP